MRSLARLLVPWLAALALLAWGASALLNVTTRSWYERDVSLRARLVVAGARDALIPRIVQHDHRKLTALVEEIARDDRILAAGVCDSAGNRIASTSRFPVKFGCDKLAVS